MRCCPLLQRAALMPCCEGFCLASVGNNRPGMASIPGRGDARSSSRYFCCLSPASRSACMWDRKHSCYCCWHRACCLQVSATRRFLPTAWMPSGCCGAAAGCSGAGSSLSANASNAYACGSHGLIDERIWRTSISTVRAPAMAAVPRSAIWPQQRLAILPNECGIGSRSRPYSRQKVGVSRTRIENTSSRPSNMLSVPNHTAASLTVPKV